MGRRFHTRGTENATRARAHPAAAARATPSTTISLRFRPSPKRSRSRAKPRKRHLSRTEASDISARAGRLILCRRFIAAVREAWRSERCGYDVCAVLRGRRPSHAGADVLDPLAMRAAGFSRWRAVGSARYELRSPCSTDDGLAPALPSTRAGLGAEKSLIIPRDASNNLARAN